MADADRVFLVVGVAMALLVRSSLPSVVDEVRRRRDAQALHRALQRDELFVRFQPVIELSTGRLYALEALVRWQDPERGELGYDLGQGYHFARPLLAHQIDELVAESPRWWTGDRSDARS